MKDKTREILMMVGFMFVLLFIGVNLAIDNVVPKKFVCNNNVIAEQLEPFDLKEMFDNCLDKCNTNNLECISLCSDMLKEVATILTSNSTSLTSASQKEFNMDLEEVQK